MSITVSITGFLANEETSLTRNSNLMKESVAFRAWRFLGNNPRGAAFKGLTLERFFFKQALYIRGFYRY